MEKIEYIYQRKRDQKEAELQRRKDIIYSANPELEEMDRQIRLLNLDNTRNTVLGRTKEAEESAERLAQAKEKRVRLMGGNLLGMGERIVCRCVRRWRR